MVHRKTGRAVRAWDNSDLDLIEQMDWVCDKEKLTKLVQKNASGTVFYCGVATNIGELRALFDRVLLLRCSPGVLQQRLRTRTTNDFARSPRAQRWLLRSKTRWESAMIRDGATVIDANRSIMETTDDVLREAR